MRPHPTVIAGSLALLAVASWSGAFELPHRFGAGDPARAAEVNANFDALAAQVDALAAQLAVLEAASASQAATVAVHDEVARTVWIPATALNVDEDINDLEGAQAGLIWRVGDNSQLGIVLPAPASWDGSDVEVRLHFTSGTVVDQVYAFRADYASADEGAVQALRSSWASTGTLSTPPSAALSGVVTIMRLPVPATELQGGIWFIDVWREADLPDQTTTTLTVWGIELAW